MQAIPVHLAQLGSLLHLSWSTDTTEIGQPKTTQLGVPVWTGDVVHRPLSTDEFTHKVVPEVMKAAAHPAPTLAKMAAVTVGGLAARTRSRGDRSGISLSAESVSPALTPLVGEWKVSNALRRFGLTVADRSLAAHITRACSGEVVITASALPVTTFVPLPRDEGDTAVHDG